MPPFQAGFLHAAKLQRAQTVLLPCACIPLCPAEEENQHPQAVLAAGGALPGPPPPACPAAPRHGGRAAPAPASISPLSVPTSFLSLCPRSVHVLSSLPPPCPRGFSLGSPGSASSALVPSPNLPGCAERGGAGCCRRGACSLCCPPNPRTMPPDARETPISLGGGAQKAIKNLQG